MKSASNNFSPGLVFLPLFVLDIYYLLAIVDISIIMCQSHKLCDCVYSELVYSAKFSLMSHMRYVIHFFLLVFLLSCNAFI